MTTQMSKKRKLDVESTVNIVDNIPVEDSKPRLTIIDLNMDCLLMIFNYLTKEDLVSLAEADVTSHMNLHQNLHEAKINQFKGCIRDAFKKVTGGIVTVSVSLNQAPRDMMMLKHFGADVTGLTFDYMPRGTDSHSSHSHRYEKSMEDAITANCRTTLIRLDFDWCHKHSMFEIEKPFPNVKYVQFDHCSLSSPLVHLLKWFPKLKSLALIGTLTSDSEYIHHHFPYIEELFLSNARPYGGLMIFTNSNLKIFTKLNPQLKFLNIRHDDVQETDSGTKGIIVDFDMLSFISDNLKQLKQLRLDLEEFQSKNEWQSVVRFQKLERLEIELLKFDGLGKIKITSEKENNKLVVIGDDEEPNYEAIAKFVIGYATSRKLKIRNYKEFDIGNEHIIRMGSTLLHLKEVYFECAWNERMPNATIQFLLQSKVLTEMTVVFFFFVEDSDNNVDATFHQMRQMFRNETIKNDTVTNGWTYWFENSITYLYECHGEFIVDSVQFKKNS